MRIRMRIFPTIRNTRFTLHTKYPQCPLPSSSHFTNSHYSGPKLTTRCLVAVAPLSCFFYAETVTTKQNELRSVWGKRGVQRGTRRQAWLRRQASGWMEEGGKCKTKVNLNNKKPMGKKPKQWRRRNSRLAAGLREKNKGEKGNQAEDSDGWEDDGRRTWSGVGFLKRIQLLFVAAPRSSAWLRRLPPPPAPFPLPFPIFFPIPSSGFYNFLLVRCVFSLLLSFSDFVFFFVFILLGIRKWTSLENKNHMQSAQSAKGRERETEEEQRSRRGTGLRGLRKCISFLIFFRRKIEMRFIYYVFHFEQRWTSLTHSLVRSSHRYLHSSFSIHSASHEKVSTSYKLHMYLGLYVSVCARIYVHKQFSEQFGIRMAI